MASLFMKSSVSRLLFGHIVENNYQSHYFHTSMIILKVGEWRKRHGIPAKGCEYGPLADLPDWSYADGRPAPLSQAQKRKIMLNKEYCEQILKLTKEVDECNELNIEKALKEEALRQKTIQNRLKIKRETFES